MVLKYAIFCLFCSLVAANNFDFSGFAPLPPGTIEQALTRTAPSGTNWDFVELEPGAFVLTEGAYQALVVEGYRCAVLVDAPEGNWQQNDLVEAIKVVTDQPICTMIYSHAHLDHIGNARRIKDAWPELRIVGHKETQANINDRLDKSDMRRPCIDRTFSYYRRFRSSGVKFSLRYTGNNHMPGNIIIYFPESSIIFHVDTVYPKWIPFDFFGLSHSLPGIAKTLQVILNDYTFNHFLAGHLEPADRSAVEMGAQFLDDCLDFAGNGLATVFAPDFFTGIVTDSGVFDPGSDNFGNSWLLFHGVFENVVDVCQEQLETKYVGVIAAADVFSRSNCYACMQALRLD